MGGYRSVEHAIADNFDMSHVAETFTRAGARGDGVGWVRGEASATDGKPWICCVLVEGGMVKLMGIECGPFFYGCPVEWLDLVPSRGGVSEENWREACRHQAATSRRHPGLRVTAVQS